MLQHHTVQSKEVQPGSNVLQHRTTHQDEVQDDTLISTDTSRKAERSTVTDRVIQHRTVQQATTGDVLKHRTVQ